MRASKYENTAKVLALWKFGDTSDHSVMAMTPAGPDVSRWTTHGFDFVSLASSTIMLAPRFVTRAGPIYTLEPFNLIDLEDEAVSIFSIQQILSVSMYIPQALRDAYLLDVKNPLLLNARIL
jgi:hypothetical protein